MEHPPVNVGKYNLWKYGLMFERSILFFSNLHTLIFLGTLEDFIIPLMFGSIL